jgi:hypothetical protein
MGELKLCMFTFTMGRELYLSRLLRSVAAQAPKYLVEHHMCFQGVAPSDELQRLMSHLTQGLLRIVPHLWAENRGSAEGMNRIVPVLDGDLAMRLDDDALLHSSQFFDHLAEVHRLRPRCVFAPFPVGLTANLGGSPSLGRDVEYSSKNDMYYCFRRVNLIGGLARAAPLSIIRDWRFSPDKGVRHSGNEAKQVAALCQQHAVPMYYLENALIVEHQESTLGQHARFNDGYFKSELNRRADGRLKALLRGFTPPIIADSVRGARRRLRSRLMVPRV